MRVAVLASGFLHGAPDSARNFRKYLLEPLDADIYVFTSRENVSREPGGSKHKSLLTNFDLDKLHLAWLPRLRNLSLIENDPNYLGELSLVLNEYNDQLLKNFRPKTPPEYVDLPYRMSCIDQYLRLAYCWDLMREEQYDVVVRARPDLVFERSLEIEQVEEGVLYVTCKRSFYDEYHSQNYLKEFLFWGSRTVMEKICAEWVYAYGIPEPLFDCDGSDYTLCPEHQFYLYAKSLGLQVEFVPLSCRYSEDDRAYEVYGVKDYPGENRVQL